MIKILKAGFFSTLQDLGRFKYRNYGVPTSGVMDAYSSQFANLVLGNATNAAVIEMTMTGAKLEFLKPTIICISGANMSPLLNKKSIALNKPITITANAILSFGKLKQGFRTYIAIKGGFKSEIVLGSQSMYNAITTVSKLKDKV